MNEITYPSKNLRRIKMKTTSKLALTLIIASCSFSALAEQADVKVTASVIGNCKIINTDDINFGALDPAQATDQKAQGSIEFACTKNVDYKLSADNGQNFNRETGKRQMNEGDENLPYDLAKDTFAGRGQGFSNPMKVSLDATVYGRDYRDLPALSYSDVLRLTLLP
jgi:spore coat protein U-like protein